MLTAVAALILSDTPRLQEGTFWSGEEVLHFSNAEAEIDETHRIKLNFRVVKKESGMWVVDRTSLLLGTRIEQTDLGPPPGAKPDTAKEYLAPAGFLLDLKPYERGVFGLDRLIHYWMPASMPDEWNAEITTNDDSYTSKAEAHFALIGKPTKVDRQYSFRYKTLDDPNGITATGTMRFDNGTGRLLEARLSVQKAFMPYGTMRGNVSLTYSDSKN